MAAPDGCAFDDLEKRLQLLPLPTSYTCWARAPTRNSTPGICHGRRRAWAASMRIGLGTPPGLVPVWGMSVRLPERVGRSKAKELSFTSRQIDGRTADGIGLVDHCVTDERLDDAVEELVALITPNSAGTNQICKSLLAHHTTTDRATALRFERNLPCGQPDDTAERIAGHTK